ncbi:MAG: fibronectin type III domain-containing protein, partial [Actinobacteria bacterium]|nr:fibronectin type III domain-containing protein [Actinomycetota bacterium]
MKFRNQNPGLFVGFSLDSETAMEHGVDYNPYVLREWRQWLTATGIYDPVNGEYKGQARKPYFTGISEFNAQMGTSFANWDDIDPRSSSAVYFQEEWKRWIETLIDHYNRDMTNWIIGAGCPENRIFGHQNEELHPRAFESTERTADSSPGAYGITVYSSRTDWTTQQNWNMNWGLFEYNPMSSEYQTNFSSIESVWNGGAHIICPYQWYGQGQPLYVMSSSMFGYATEDFYSQYKNTPQKPRLWNEDPQTAIYGLYGMYDSAQKSSGTDVAQVQPAAVEGIPKNSISLRNQAYITYTVSLPGVTGNQRLYLKLLTGIQDSESNHVGYDVSVIINSAVVRTISQDASWWRRWEPALIDLTSYAGTTISLQLKNNQDQLMCLGEPRIYKVSDDLSAPANPTLLTAAATGSKTVQLNWNESSSQGVVEYKIYRSNTQDFTPSEANFIAFTNTNSYTDENNLLPSTAYYYKVSAVDQAGNESISTLVYAATTLADDITAPNQVTAVYVTVDDNNKKISIFWNPSDAVDLKEYRVYRSTHQNFPISGEYLLGTTTNTSFEDRNTEFLIENAGYYYKVTAVDKNQNESYESQVVTGVVTDAS